MSTSFDKHYITCSSDHFITYIRGNTPQSTNYTATYLPSQKLSMLDEPYMQDIVEEAGKSSWMMYSYGPLHMAEQKQDDQLEHTYSSSLRIRDVVLKICQRRWMIGRSGERVSGISVLVAWHDDDDDDDDIYYIYIICICLFVFCFMAYQPPPSFNAKSS